jgi:hypothetical protein
MAGTTVESSVPQGDLPAELPDDDAALANGADQGDDPAVEARAREMGWKPLAEYRGPPGKWQPAADFISRGENILPIVRDQNRRLTERLGKLETEFGALRATAGEQLQIIKDLREMGRTADKRGYDRAMAEINAKQRAAVEAGDTKTYDQLVEQAEALRSSRPATATAEPPVRPAATEPPARPQLSTATQAFIGDNPWFSNNKLLSDTMIGFHQEVLNERNVSQATLNADPALDRELLEEAKARVVEKYPERFGVEPAQPAPRPAAPRNPRRAASVAAPTPEPPAPRPGGTPTINSIQDPTERAQAREAYNRMKRQLPDYTEAEYMALYDDPHADILVEQQKRRTQPNGR